MYAGLVDAIVERMRTEMGANRSRLSAQVAWHD